MMAALALAGCAAEPPSPAASPAPQAATAAMAAELRPAVRPLAGADGDYDALLARAADAQVVLLGESTHGTHEFYRERARITRLLVERHGFTAVAVEGDWPRAQRVDRWVRGEGTDAGAEAALAGFTEFPRWMWRNRETAALATWLREHNAARPAAGRVGFHGLDLYAVPQAAREVVRYLETTDPAAAREARERYACILRYDEGSDYGEALARGSGRVCQEGVGAQLAEMREREAVAGAGADRALFDAVRNAAAAAAGEAYYRESAVGTTNTWNLRDRHFAATLEALVARGHRVVVWAHNTHVGDARATEMSRRGELNLGQLARDRWEGRAVLVGFTTHAGTVRAAREWGGQASVREVRPALPESFAAVFHATGVPDFLLLTGGPVAATLREPRLERAIGVIYRPETERQSHYFEARLPAQFDAVIHLDRTRAVEAL
jgi:erythromycin esterase-like protein